MIEKSYIFLFYFWLLSRRTRLPPARRIEKYIYIIMCLYIPIYMYILFFRVRDGLEDRSRRAQYRSAR